MPTPTLPSFAEIALEVRSLDKIATGFRLRADRAEASLKAAKAELVAAANALAQTGPDGKKLPVAAEGVQVIFPSDTLVSKLDAPLLAKVRAYSGRVFAKLFQPEYRPIKDFRLEALRRLPRKDAETLIAACEKPSTPRVLIS